jgi:hypothetical protein
MSMQYLLLDLIRKNFSCDHPKQTNRRCPASWCLIKTIFTAIVSRRVAVNVHHHHRVVATIPPRASCLRSEARWLKATLTSVVVLPQEHNPIWQVDYPDIHETLTIRHKVESALQYRPRDRSQKRHRACILGNTRTITSCNSWNRRPGVWNGSQSRCRTLRVSCKVLYRSIACAVVYTQIH